VSKPQRAVKPMFRASLDGSPFSTLGHMPDVVLVHGAATTPAIWEPVIALLDDCDVCAPPRPGSGDLAIETDWLAELCDEAVVFGMSGGATLVLSLAARANNARALIAHEPAAGSLSPELFGPLALALAADGVAGFGSALYGPRWSLADGVTLESVTRDLGMFRAFEPQPPSAQSPRPLLSTGSDSPPLRHTITQRLVEAFGVEALEIAGGHCCALDAPEAVAEVIRERLRHSPRALNTVG
jgi:pimeloyl-ACP methyl ester carboxylesterase